MKPGDTATLAETTSLLRDFSRDVYRESTRLAARVGMVGAFEVVLLLEHIPEEEVWFPPTQVVTWGFWKVLTGDGRVGYVRETAF